MMTVRIPPITAVPFTTIGADEDVEVTVTDMDAVDGRVIEPPMSTVWPGEITNAVVLGLPASEQVHT